MEELLVKLSYLTSMLKQETVCNICLQTLKNPVTTRCLHNFCNDCLSRVLSSNKSTICPLCNTPVCRRVVAKFQLHPIVKKISPIIEAIKNDSPVDILSYYKGKATPSFGSVDLAAIESTRINESHPGESVVEKNATMASSLNFHESKVKTANNSNLNHVEEEQVSFQKPDNLDDLEHTSLSQNTIKPALGKRSADLQVLEIAKSPSKKVTEWLSKNSVEDCLSPGINEENEADNSNRDANPSENEYLLNISHSGRSRRKVYKGLRSSGSDLRKFNDSKLNFSRMSSELDIDESIEDKGIIKCPDEINDTFDNLVKSAKCMKSDNVCSPQSSSVCSTFNEEKVDKNHGIGLFESLPMPNDKYVSRRRRSAKKLKLDTSDNSISSLKSHKSGISKKTYNRKRGLRIDERSEDMDVENYVISDSNPVLSKDGLKGKSCYTLANEVSVTDSQEKRNKENSSLLFKRNLNDDSESSLDRSEKKKEANTPKWPHFGNTLKDFHESKKVILPVLDVSVGEPIKASKHQHKPRISTLGSLEKVSCDEIADIENKSAQSNMSEPVISSKTSVDAEKIVESSINQNTSLVQASNRFSHPNKDKTARKSVTFETEMASVKCNSNVDVDNVELQLTSENFNDQPKNISVNDKSNESPRRKKMEHPIRGILTLNHSSLAKNPNYHFKSVEDLNIFACNTKLHCSPQENIFRNAENATLEKPGNQLVVNTRKLVPFFKLQRLTEKKGKKPRVKFLSIGSLRHSDSSRRMHDVCIATEDFSLSNMRIASDLTSVGIQTVLNDEAECKLISKENEFTKEIVNSGSMDFGVSASQDKSDKRNKILEILNSDFGSRKQKTCSMSNDDICEIPETTSITGGYIGESDLSGDELGAEKEQGDDENAQVVAEFKPESDEDSDIVEGSQKNGISIERPLVKERPISLVASALVGEELALVKEFACKFNLHFNNQFNGFEDASDTPCTTHIVTKEDSGGKVFCTFKYLCGLISGSWVVSLKWVIDSLAADKVLDEKLYEFMDSAGNNKAYRELHGPKKLFEGFYFIYKEPFSVFTVQQLKDIIQLGGGNIHSVEAKKPQMDRKYLAIVDASEVDANSAFCNFLYLQKIAVLSCEWVIECVEECRIISISSHVINVSYESNPIEIYNKLLKMGYEKDIISIEE